MLSCVRCLSRKSAVTVLGVASVPRRRHQHLCLCERHRSLTIAIAIVDRDRAEWHSPNSRRVGPGSDAVPARRRTEAIDPALLAGLKWRSIGPARGGRSQAVAGSSSRPLEYYFGATGGGLWKTTDGGVTWRAVSDKFFSSSSVGAVAVAESNPDVVYVGMGETELRGNIIQGDGVYKSTDGGKTFTHVGLEKTLAISRIRIHPTNPDIVYVAALGDPYGPNPERGVFKSTDGGKIMDAIALPRRQDRRGRSVDGYRASRRAVRRPVGGISDAALALERRPGQRPVQDHRWRGHVDRTHPQARSSQAALGKNWRLGIRRGRESRLRHHRGADGGVFVSDDGGASWKRINDDRRLRQRAFYYTRIYADPQAKDTVYILNTGIYRSTDAGKTHPRDSRAARRQPRSLDRAERCEADDQQQRRRRERFDQRGRELDRPEFSDRAVLQRDHDRARAVPRLRRAAGQQHGVRVEHRRREPLRRGWRRERLHRARSAGHGCVLRRKLRWPADANQSAHRRDARHQRLAGQPDGIFVRRHDRTLPVDLSDRDRSDRSAHALRHIAARLEIDERGTVVGAYQSRPDAPRSVDAWVHPAARSRSTRPASKPTPSSSRSHRALSTVASSGPDRTTGTFT